MALYEPFPNYIWNLSVAIAMESGAQLAGTPVFHEVQNVNVGARPRLFATFFGIKLGVQ